MSNGPNNPTAVQDAINANKDEAEQYPSPGPEPATVDTEELEHPFCEYPQELDTNYTTLRCSRATHPDLAAAQAFFNRLRREAASSPYPWRSEGAIFRTGRYWVKRVVYQDYSK